MRTALLSLSLPADVESRIWDYLVMAADSMRNTLT
jgi:truncated hemoglobin YjbI